MQNTIEQLERIIGDYTSQLQGLNEESFSLKPSPSRWSGKEFLGHLIDSAQNNIRRFVVAQYEDQPYIVYAQNDWVTAADYQHYPLNDLIAVWVLMNKHIVILLKNLPAGVAGRNVQTQELHSIEWLAADYNKHLLHHLHQILHLEEIGYP